MALEMNVVSFDAFVKFAEAVNFTLSRDDATGAITVKYESPEKLPIYFSWTATIDVDGNVTSTPLEVMDQAAIAASKAGADGQRDGNVVIVP